jgi:prophage regulatory protein
MDDLTTKPVLALQGAKLIRLPAVQERVGMRRTAVYELIKAGKFPRPVKIGGISAWVDAEITQWMESLVFSRDSHRHW